MVWNILMAPGRFVGIHIIGDNALLLVILLYLPIYINLNSWAATRINGQKEK